ncbi:hypothetical protein AgCh_037330 [Apium graveolens]
MNPEYSSNSLNYSFTALPIPNSTGYSYPTLPNSEEHNLQPFQNTIISDVDVGNGIGNVSHLGDGNGMSFEGQSGGMAQTDGSNIEQTGGSSASQISGSRPRGCPRGSKNKAKENALEMTSNVMAPYYQGSDSVMYILPSETSL